MKTTIIPQFSITNQLVDRNVAQVNHEMSLQTPRPAGNNLNWVLGHLTYTYNGMLPVLGQEPVWTEDISARYTRGSETVTANEAVAFDDIRAAWETVAARFIIGLENLPEEKLGDPAPYSPAKNPDETMGSLLGLLVFHQAYHAGQLGLLRRMAGLDSALK